VNLQADSGKRDKEVRELAIPASLCLRSFCTLKAKTKIPFRSCNPPLFSSSILKHFDRNVIELSESPLASHSCESPVNYERLTSESKAPQWPICFSVCTSLHKHNRPGGNSPQETCISGLKRTNTDTFDWNSASHTRVNSNKEGNSNTHKMLRSAVSIMHPLINDRWRLNKLHDATCTVIMHSRLQTKKSIYFFSLHKQKALPGTVRPVRCILFPLHIFMQEQQWEKNQEPKATACINHHTHSSILFKWIFFLGKRCVLSDTHPVIIDVMHAHATQRDWILFHQFFIFPKEGTPSSTCAVGIWNQWAFSPAHLFFSLAVMPVLDWFLNLATDCND
jgi:hypothetical protein